MEGFPNRLWHVRMYTVFCSDRALSPLFVLLMLLVPAVPDAGRRPAHPGKTRCVQAALPENITDAGRRPAHPGKTRCIQAALPENITDAGRRPAHPAKTRCIQAALPENITDAGRRPAHPGRPRGRKMVTGEPDRNLTSPTPLPFGVIVVKIAIVGYNTSRNLL